MFNYFRTWRTQHLSVHLVFSPERFFPTLCVYREICSLIMQVNSVPLWSTVLFFTVFHLLQFCVLYFSSNKKKKKLKCFLLWHAIQHNNFASWLEAQSFHLPPPALYLPFILDLLIFLHIHTQTRHILNTSCLATIALQGPTVQIGTLSRWHFS